jgi:SAM-dependent methyltransferase
VLDLASGEGYGSNMIAQSARSVIGVDISEDAVRHAAQTYKQSNLKYRRGSAAQIPVASASVDIVVSFETIEHHNLHEQMISEFKRILKEDGLLLISSPDKLYYTDIPKFHNQHHVKELYEGEFRQLIQRHFRNATLYSQKIVGGSLLSALDGADNGHFTAYTGNFEQVRPAKISGAQYLICLASDGALPTLSVSFFDGEIISEIRRQGDSLLHDLKNSLSFRIGRAITAPLRWLRS